MKAKLLEWTGAAALIAAPFLINYTSGKILACVGLTLLTFQAFKMKAYNLVTLNAFGIIGYTWSIFA